MVDKSDYETLTSQWFNLLKVFKYCMKAFGKASVAIDVDWLNRVI